MSTNEELLTKRSVVALSAGDEKVGQCIENVTTQGYGTLPGVFGPREMERALVSVSKWCEASRNRTTRALPPLAQDSPIVWNLQTKDPFFLDLLFASEDLERVLIHFLNDEWYKAIPAGSPNYILRNYVARSSDNALAIHLDSFLPYRGDLVISMQCSLALEGMDLDSGATLVVPGSHQWGRWAVQSALDGAVPIEAEPGDLVVWDSRIWHGAGQNNSERTRWNLTATFTRWWIKQAFDITRTLPRETYARLTDKERAILGYCTLPFGDESEGIDIRQGYESLGTRRP